MVPIPRVRRTHSLGPPRARGSTGVVEPAARRRSRLVSRRSARADAGRRRDERGAALVETVLLLPLVFLIVFGIIEFSSAFHDASVTSDASRAGGRIASAQARNPD